MSKITEVIELKGICKSYKNLKDREEKKRVIFSKIDLTIESGDLVCITGRSGEGKSTLLHIMAGLDKPDEGEIFWFGKNITRNSEQERTILRKKNIGLLFQHHGLLRDFTVLENIALSKSICETNWKKSKEEAEKWLDKFNLIERQNQYPFELSGGEKQRVALIRALIVNPKILLADEPTGNLDPHNTELILNIIKDIWKKTQMSVILVTHNKTIQKNCQKKYKICVEGLKML